MEWGSIKICIKNNDRKIKKQEEQIKIKVEGKDIEQMEKYKYLEIIINNQEK